MDFRGRRHNLGLHILLFFILTPFFQDAVEIVCPQIGYLGSPSNLTCIGTGTTHSYIWPKGGVLTICNMSSSECAPEATVTIPNSSYSILTVPMVNLSHQGNWTCSVGDDVSHCLFTVAMPEDKDTSSRTSMAVIIGSVVAVIVIVIIIILLVFFLMKMKSKRVEQPETNTVTYAPDSIYDVVGQTNVTSRDINKPSASYDIILNARFTHSPGESSLYDLASR